MTKNEFTPYIGVRAFRRTHEDQRVFFGRNYESNQIVAHIFANQVSLIYGATGVGKTSILNGKIIPTLEDQFEVLPVARVGFRMAPIDTSTVIRNWYIFKSITKSNA